MLSYTVEFPVQKGENALGKVVRTGLFTPRYYYDFYNPNDEMVVRGITRAFSLGLFFPRSIQIDLYDASEQIGMISGEWWTSSRAKFTFYDFNGQDVASAYLSDESCDFMLVSSKNGELLAEIIGKSHGDASVWEFTPKGNLSEIDERALSIFGAFIADFQKAFVRPPKVIYNETIIYQQRNNQNQ